ncbi:PecA family PE domain-processing aspartic protease [[Mycobacterium] holstebronense]|uniref:PecA family PE domain-processing aspartic protease n=1 Tax=[Mycobacterium] holstebronense TaxID=3064288 RepID=A0ABM9LD62_9MYCO|nr:PecA family PE domain-processing aspartic protease [Mycolicibacter sp. MU0102]CAJ1497017.1 PecA family PE domain-processing aspartic protease [Mycolicibacter sp. MU0102]
MAARRRMIGATAVVGAFVSLGTPAPTAHADIDDLFQPIIDALSAFDPGIAADTDPGFALASLDTMFDGWYQNLVYAPINDLEQWIFGGAADASVAGSAAASGSDATIPDSFTIPLQVNSGTEPVVNVSVGGGPESPVLVDTGSAGLVMPIWDINPFGITGLPTGINIGQFGNSVDYVYAELPTTVTFTDAAGATVTSGTTDVDAVLFSFPVSLSALFTGWNISSYLGANADGVLGIGANAVGPTPDAIPTTALPGALGDGVLIDQKGGALTFGADPLTGGVTVDGSPNSTLYVSFDGGQTASPVSSIMDSGGVNGTIPASLTNGSAGDVLAAGQPVSVYAGDPTKGGTLLYDYTVNSNSSNSPTIVSGASMNTGNWLFQQNQVYVSTAGDGSMHIVPNNVVTP